MTNYSKEEKQKMFWALVKVYPEHYRGELSAEELFKDDPEKLEFSLKMIQENKLEDYKLIKKLGDELEIDVPKI